MVRLQDPALDINGFDAMMTDPHPVEGWRAQAVIFGSDGTSFGDPEAVISAIASQLADGDLENVDRFGNREATFYISFDADGAPNDPGRAISMGQAALERACRFKGWAPLSWVDVLAGAETSVMEMTSAVVSKDFDDLREMTDGQRVIKVTVHARPFVRSLNKVTIEAPPLPPAPGGTPPADVVVDSGSATTGWETTTSLAAGVGWDNAIGVNVAPFTGMVYGTTSYFRGGGLSVVPIVELTRAATIAVDPLRPYIQVKGYCRTRSNNGAWGSNMSITFDIPSSEATLVSLTINNGTFVALFQQIAGITGIPVTAKYRGPAYDNWDAQVGVDSITRVGGVVSGTFTGKAQTRQVEVYGSQRTELSIAVLGLDDAGTSPQALGEQVLVHAASAGSDGRAKFLGCRDKSALAGTPDTAATTAVYNALATTSAPTVFSFPAANLLPGEYIAYARLKATSAGTRTLSYAASLDGAGSLDASDPATGWYTSQVAALTTYRIFPLGEPLMLPPASIEDPAATLSIKVAADTATVVELDEIWLAHVDSGQVSLLDTNDSGISAIRLDAATVDAPQPSAWVGVATADGTGTMMAAGPRIQAFEQHMAEQGLVQISTITPGCATSRVSASYFPRAAHDVAPTQWTKPVDEEVVG